MLNGNDIHYSICLSGGRESLVAECLVHVWLMNGHLTHYTYSSEFEHSIPLGWLCVSVVTCSHLRHKLQVHMRGSTNFRHEREGGPGTSVKKSSDNLFYMFSPQLILQNSNGLFQRNYNFLRLQKGSNILQGCQS